jgi:hypothetical protein
MDNYYFIDKFRIFTPQEILKLYMYGEKLQSRNEFLFFTMGFRYNEGQEILAHPEYFNIDERIIHFKSNNRWDRALVYKDRDIYLSYWDMINLHNYIVTNKTHIINPKYGNLTRNMNNWAKAANIWSPGIGVHCLRLTRFVWLLKSFPSYTAQIIESMDYNPTKHYKLSMNDHKLREYRSVPFTKQELSLTKSLLNGWSGALE